MLAVPSAVIALLLASGSLLAANDPDLPDFGSWTETAKASEHSVVISGTHTTPGHNETTPRKGTGDNGSSNHTNATQDRVPDPPAVREPVAFECVSLSEPCALPTPTATPAPTATSRSIPAVTITDLASFRPAAAGLASEPDHAGVAGLPVNLTTSASTHTVRGTLFDFDVTVRFTPDHYTFDYGDGATTTTDTGGRSWTSTGDPQFTPTSTSHTYSERGEYTATVTISYSPDVNFGDGIWRPVAGYITAASPGDTIHIYEAHTALVAHTCQEDPAGPGC